jgi:hypothetical protein
MLNIYSLSGVTSHQRPLRWSTLKKPPDSDMVLEFPVHWASGQAIEPAPRARAVFKKRLRLILDFIFIYFPGDMKTGL